MRNRGKEDIMASTIKLDIIDMTNPSSFLEELVDGMLGLLTLHTSMGKTLHGQDDVEAKKAVKPDCRKTMLTKQPKYSRDSLGRFLPKYGVPCASTLKRKARRQRAKARKLAPKSNICSCGGTCGRTK